MEEPPCGTNRQKCELGSLLIDRPPDDSPEIVVFGGDPSRPHLLSLSLQKGTDVDAELSEVLAVAFFGARLLVGFESFVRKASNRVEHREARFSGFDLARDETLVEE